MIYFAYGSNMNVFKFGRRIRVDGNIITHHIFNAILEDYEFSFSKVSKNNPEYVFANISKCKGKVVEGKAYAVSEVEMNKLDMLEGVAEGEYKRVKVKIKVDNGTEFDAYTYVGLNNVSDERKVSFDYLYHLIRGSKGLSDYYIDKYIIRNYDINVSNPEYSNLKVTLSDLELLVEYKMERPWKKPELKEEKLRKLHDKLNEVYGLNIGLEFIDNPEIKGSYDIIENKIYVGKFSVITYLHELAHGIGINLNGNTTEKEARFWSETLFFNIFPEKKYMLKGRSEGISNENWIPVKKIDRPENDENLISVECEEISERVYKACCPICDRENIITFYDENRIHLFNHGSIYFYPNDGWSVRCRHFEVLRRLDGKMEVFFKS